MSEQFLYFLQQMFNGVTLGSTYALIAIGYTMVYGIIGMINFAHGEVYMIGSYVSFMIIAALMMMGIDTSWLLVAAGFIRPVDCGQQRKLFRVHHHHAGGYLDSHLSGYAGAHHFHSLLPDGPRLPRLRGGSENGQPARH